MNSFLSSSLLMNRAVVAKAGDAATVTEALLIECVQEVTPKPCVGMAMKTLEPLKTQ